MALYPFRCTACGIEQDHWIRMSTYAQGERPPCGLCGGVLSRVVVNFHEVRTENTWKPYYSDQLADQPGEKVYVSSRADYERLMQQKGVTPIERGAYEQARQAERLDQSQAKAKAGEAAVESFETFNRLSDESLRERAGEVRDQFQQEESA